MFIPFIICLHRICSSWLYLKNCQSIYHLNWEETDTTDIETWLKIGVQESIVAERKRQKLDSIVAAVDRSFVYSSPHRRVASVFWECDLHVLNEEHHQHVCSRWCLDYIPLEQTRREDGLDDKNFVSYLNR